MAQVVSEHALGFAHRFRPAQADGDGRVLLLLHGTGGNEDDLLPLASMLEPAAAVLSPRGRVLENGMPRFFRRLANGMFDLEDLKFRTEELADFVQAAARRYKFDPDGLVAVGYSNGANIAAAMLLLRPEVLAGAILLHAMLPLTSDVPPDLRGKPVFLTGGQTDVVIPPEQTAMLANVLQAAGANLTMHWEPGGHSLTPSEIRAAQECLASLTFTGETHTGVAVARERPPRLDGNS